MSKELNQRDEIIKSVKEKYSGQVFEVTTFIDGDENQERIIYVKKPDRKTRSAAEKVASNDGYRGVEVFLRGMYLGGDDLEEIIKNDDALLTAGDGIVDIVAVKQGKVQRV